jgi:lysophospholipase L1-like esterase
MLGRSKNPFLILFIFTFVTASISIVFALPRQRPAKSEQKVVYLGDSITYYWWGYLAQSHRFIGNPPINRGVSGEFTQQMLARFDRDVITLQPQVVVILGGTNDIVKSPPSLSLDPTEKNLSSMVRRARENGIQVVLSSLPPVGEGPQFPETTRRIQATEKIHQLNNWIKNYSEANHCIFVDFYTVLAGKDGLFPRDLSDDGIHPNIRGYAVMEPILEVAVKKAIASSPANAEFAHSKE